VLAQAPLPVFAFDLQDLALSFNLDRPVVNAKNFRRFEDRVRQGRVEYLVISDRALRVQTGDPCMRRIAKIYNFIAAAGIVARTHPPWGQPL
jgi:hypothetical protein